MTALVALWLAAPAIADDPPTTDTVDNQGTTGEVEEVEITSTDGGTTYKDAEGNTYHRVYTIDGKSLYVGPDPDGARAG